MKEWTNGVSKRKTNYCRITFVDYLFEKESNELSKLGVGRFHFGNNPTLIYCVSLIWTLSYFSNLRDHSFTSKLKAGERESDTMRCELFPVVCVFLIGTCVLTATLSVWFLRTRKTLGETADTKVIKDLT